MGELKIRVLVTGAGGFVGSHLCEELLRCGCEVTAMVHYNVDKISHLKGKLNIIRSDIRFIDECMEATEDVDAVVHLAALIHVDRSRQLPQLFWDTNVGGTQNMLEAARKRCLRFLHMSTCEIIGHIPHGKASENYTNGYPRSPYAASKHSAEAYCKAYHSTYDLDIRIARCFNITGPRQKLGKKGAVIPIFINQALQENPITIYGSGQQIRDFTDVRDIARGVSELLLRPRLSGELIHLCNGVEWSVNDIAELILEVCDSDIQPIHIDGRPGELVRSVGDNTKAYKLLKWKPRVELKQTIKDIRRYMELKQNG